MTTPVIETSITPVVVLYATVADLRAVMAGTDSGTGSPAALTDAQLTLALQAGSNRVSVYAGNTFDGSSADAVPPAILHDLALDLATFWAYKTYLKHKEMGPQHPVYLAYVNAMQVLHDVRDGKILLDPVPAPGIGMEAGTVINRIPCIFTGEDSNTRLNPLTGTLESDVPFNAWSPRGISLADDGGPIYQG